MANTNFPNDILIWRVLDGEASREEQVLFEKRLAKDELFRKEVAAANEFQRMLIGQQNLLEPSMRFEKNVMEQVAQTAMVKPATAFINNKVVWGIGGLFVVMLATLTFYLVKSVDFQFAETSGNKWYVLDWPNLPTGIITLIFAILAGTALPLMVDLSLRTKKAAPRA